jgi:hypothetical protein
MLRSTFTLEVTFPSSTRRLHPLLRALRAPLGLRPRAASFIAGALWELSVALCQANASLCFAPRVWVLGFFVRLCLALRSLALCRLCAIAPSFFSGSLGIHDHLCCRRHPGSWGHRLELLSRSRAFPAGTSKEATTLHLLGQQALL